MALGILVMACAVLWMTSWWHLRASLCRGEQLMGAPGTALLINDAAFVAYLAGVAAMTLALGVVAARVQQRRLRWVVFVSCVPIALIAFIVVATAGAESWYKCAH